MCRVRQAIAIDQITAQCVTKCNSFDDHLIIGNFSIGFFFYYKYIFDPMTIAIFIILFNNVSFVVSLIIFVSPYHFTFMNSNSTVVTFNNLILITTGEINWRNKKFIIIALKLIKIFLDWKCREKII